MQSPQGLFKHGKKHGKTVAILGLAGGCAALFGFALIGSFGSPDAAPFQFQASQFDRTSYFTDGPADASHGKAPVRHLGMSAVLEDAASDQAAIAALAGKAEETSDDTGSPTRHAAIDPAQDPHLQPDNVSVGDRITVVTPDGLSYVYRVTAREAVGQTPAKPSLDKAGKIAQPAPVDASCETLNSLAAGAFRLVIESVTDNDSRAPAEQKL